ncbi:TIGR03643 family protein [Alphaproteobacteria bacterium]|nr:TIGR03643 family protein [Alphaproteobacteria bacterium]
MTKKKQPLSDDEIIELAWCDKTSFDDIFFSTGLKEPEVIKLMRKNMKLGSFRLWRKRVSGRASKHRSRINGSW